ncbi:UNVERIFIED_CONTAM: hypothetical protein RMT77_018496 [Armadillidium vulgare]
MSTRCRIMFWGCSYVKTPLQNGIGRYVPQLQRITFKFCKSSGPSHGMREYIEQNLLNFTKDNPHVVVYVKPRRKRAPCLKAEYLNGASEYVGAFNLSKEDISKWVEFLRTKSGETTTKFLMKRHHTDFPSVQGPWTAFTHKDPKINVTQLPNEELSEFKLPEPSGTEELLDIYWRQQRQKEQNREEEN